MKVRTRYGWIVLDPYVNQFMRGPSGPLGESMPTETIEKTKKVKVKVEPLPIVLDQTPGRKTFYMKTKPDVVITKEIRVNRDAMMYNNAEEIFTVRIKEEGKVTKTVTLMALEILGPSTMKFKQGKWVGCSLTGASAWIETTAPLVGKDRNGKPWGVG